MTEHQSVESNPVVEMNKSSMGEPVTLDALMEKCKNDDDDEIMLFHAQELCEEDLIALIEAQTAVSKVYRGNVKSFSSKTGYGFLNSEGSNEDIFVHASQISSDSLEPKLDDKAVEYLITKNDSGKPVAIHVTDIGGGPFDEGDEEVKLKHHEINTIASSLIDSWLECGERVLYPGDEDWAMSMSSIGANEAELLENREKIYKGHCKWFRRNMGLISMDDTNIEGIKWIDYLLLVKHTDIKAKEGHQRLHPGQAVEFQLAISSRHRLLAVNVTGPNGTQINVPQERGPRGRRDGEYNPVCLEEKGIKSGTVLWFDAKKQYGFITPDEEGENYFVHASEIRARDPKRLAGQKVQFKVGQLKDGKMVAMHVSGTALMLTGTMLWFDPKKKYGFITPSRGGDNVFVHGSEIFARDFANLNNEAVEYRMGKLKDGKDVAVEVTGPYGAMLPCSRMSRPGPGPWGGPPSPIGPTGYGGGWGSRGPPPPSRSGWDSPPPRSGWGDMGSSGWGEGRRSSGSSGWSRRGPPPPRGGPPRRGSSGYNMREPDYRSPHKARGRPSFDDNIGVKRPRW